MLNNLRICLRNYFYLNMKLFKNKIRFSQYWKLRGALRVKFMDIAPKLRYDRADRSGHFRYITNNTLQISQNVGYLISSIG